MDSKKIEETMVETTTDTMTDHKVSQAEFVENAQGAIDSDHNLTVLECFKFYPKAIAWSAMLSAVSIMDGYDLHVLGLLYAVPAFQKAYGEVQPNGSYQLTAAWQSGLSNGSAVGILMGLLVAGELSERFGFRKTIMAAVLIMPCLIFIQFFAPSLVALEVAQVLLGESQAVTTGIMLIAQGFPLGVFQTVTLVYATEVAPTAIRALLTSYASQMWVSWILGFTILLAIDNC